MMKINSTNGVSGVHGENGVNVQAGQLNITQEIDTVSKNIQNQITSAQQQLQELSSNEEMSVEEKIKKRQELRQQINDLNNQLRQHQIEQQREKRQAASMENVTAAAGQGEVDSRGTGFSKVRVKAIISADAAMNQAQVYGSVNNQMESKMRSLQGEIRQDKVRGIDVESKETELAKLEKRAANAEASQIRTLGTANSEMREAREAEQKEEEEKAKVKSIKIKQSLKEKQMEIFGTVRQKKSTDTENTMGNAQVIGNQNSLNIRL